MTHVATPYHKNPSSDSNKIYNIGKPFLGYYCFIINLSDSYPSKEKKRRINIACSLYDRALAEESLPLPGGHGIYNFGGPFIRHNYCTLSLSDLFWE